MTQSTQPVNPQSVNSSEDLSVKGFINFAKTALNMVVDIFDIVVEPFFKIRESGRIVRSMLFVIGFMIWWFFAWTSHPPDFANIRPWFDLVPDENAPAQLQIVFAMLSLFQDLTQRGMALILPFFAPDIFRHVLVIGLASWIAFEWAAIYLDDIFELRNTDISRKFIWKAAFVGTLEKVHIQNGDVAVEDKDSHVVKIGGPGQVIVHLENAVLFEKINGEAHIITSEDKDKKILLEGFERLRTVKYPNKQDAYAIFDRRDQFIGSQTVVGRTKDGITVTAKNVSAVFSIHEGKVEIAESPVLTGGNGKIVTPQISRRVSFDRAALETAIKNLVYNQSNRPWTETAKQNIFPNVRTWIGQHTLDEFLTNLSPQEMAEVQDRVQPLSGQPPLPSIQSPYLSRAELTNFVQGNPETWGNRGFDVHWVGVGTWETPEEIPQQHKQAFELSVQNRILGSEMELSRIFRESRLKELRRLITTVPIPTARFIKRIDPLFMHTLEETDAYDLLDLAEKIPGLSGRKVYGTQGVFGGASSFRRLSRAETENPAMIKYNLMLAYREKLRNAKDWYERNQQTPPQELLAAINYLSNLPNPLNVNDQSGSA
ncbi:MAG: hypothetical protein Fur0022_12860 [Anaerolineales bacterium]